MRVRETKESASGTLVSIEFIRTTEENLAGLKNNIKTWVRDNYPTMTWEEFFNRLEAFNRNSCAIRMV